MADDNRDERKLPASERRLRQAREQGRVPRSREAAHAGALLAMLAVAGLYGPTLADRTIGIVRGALRFDRGLSRDPARAVASLATAATDALWAVLPLLVAPVAAALLTTMAIGGVVWSVKPVQPDLSRIDPLAGLGRIFSIDGSIELVKLAAIAAGVGVIGGWFVASGFSQFAALAGLPLPAALVAAHGKLVGGLALAALVIVAAALVDAPVQIWRFRASMRMTPAEARQEARESDGDPRVKARVREKQRTMARGRMLSAVPRADVIVTNPTHYAVAIKYDDAAMTAPRVLAKGADLLAARIREIAAEAGVPTLEAPALARALYRHVEVEQEIPAALYAAVAQVLAYVYQLNQHLKGRGARPRVPGIDVPAGLDPQEAEA